MNRRRVFLSAEWRDLLLFNFAVPDDLLKEYLPPGVELDYFNGSAYVSLVAFDFLKTKVRGVSWPFHTNFSEINLRFYAKRNGVRGVVFVREIVPQPLTAWIAKVLYNEPYVAAPIASSQVKSESSLKKNYTLIWKGKNQTISVTAKPEQFMPDEASREHFFKEHEWGYGRARSGEATVYRVEHPHWQVFPVVNSSLAFDFGVVYGDKWSFLTGRNADSVVFAAGSAIQVFMKE
jgi:uncharacterized protein YqjF (DUF2071 family)